MARKPTIAKYQTDDGQILYFNLTKMRKQKSNDSVAMFRFDEAQQKYVFDRYIRVGIVRKRVG